MSDLTVAISFVLLWLVVVVMALVIWVLARQIGVLHERIAPAGALSLRNGLSIGDAAPQVTVEMVSGSQRTIGAANPSGRSTLLFFFSPTCPVCKELLPIIKHSSQSEQDWIDVVLAGDGDPAEHQKILQSAQMQAFPLTLSAALGIAYHVGKLPYAALIDEQGLLQSAGLVNSREHIESLYEAKEMGVKDLQTYLSHNAAEQRQLQMFAYLKNSIPVLFSVLSAVYTAPVWPNTSAFDYRMNCEGCHAVAGAGVEPHVPALKNNLAPFLRTPAGREYLIRVPGVRQISISNAKVADLLNYVVFTLSDIEETQGVRPFSEAEVAAYRQQAFLDVPAARARAMDAYESH